MNNSIPSGAVVQQRIRNRLLEYLEMVVEFERYHPPFDLDEVFNQWEDWVRRPIETGTWPSPTYTLKEAELLRKVDAAWDALCNVYLQTPEDEKAVLRKPEWGSFVESADAGIREMRKRGKLSEEYEFS
jgi:hypothetical protein